MLPANNFETFPQETTTFEEMLRSLTNSIDQTGNSVLPFDPSATSAAASATAQSNAAANVTQSNPLILVVDDDKGARDIIQRFLSKFGFRTDFATNGLNAVKAFKSGKVYSAVIMDLCMPYMNGVEATSQIRSVDLNIPIICVTGNTLPSESENCLKKGMNAVIHKPVRREGLFNTLGRFFFMGNNSSTMTFPPISLYQAPSSASASSSSNGLSPSLNELPSDFSPLNEPASSSSAFPEGMDEN
jgi:CheY-like chemotaxis protein